MDGRSPSEPISPRISLFHQAVIYAKEGSRKLIDGRWNLSQSEAKLGIKLSADAKKQLMACTGEIVCEKPGRTGRWRRYDEQEPITATAVSVLRPDLLVTAQHVFFDGKRAVVSFERCSFRSYLHRRTAIPIVVERDQRRGYVFNNEDFVVLRLKRELKDCNAFAIDDADSSLPEGEQVLSVTAHQRNILNKLSRLEPVVAKGKVRNVFSGFYGGPPFYHADIDLDEGGSGGAIFALRDGRPRFPHAQRSRVAPVSNDEGRLVLRGILVAYGQQAKSGQPYSQERNFTIVIGLQADFRDLVKGKAHMSAAVAAAPCVCSQSEAATINVMSDSVAVAQSEALSPLLQQHACGPDATPDGEAGEANASCTKLEKELKELSKALKLAASRRGKEKQHFRLENATSCPICFTYNRCNDYGCWDEAVRLDGHSTHFAGTGERAPVIKNPQFCKSADVGPPLPPRKPELAHITSPATAADSSPPQDDFCEYADAPEVKFIAAKAKAEREGVHTLTSEDIRGLSLEQIRELRGY